MKTKTWEYGTRKNAEVLDVFTNTVVLLDEENEGHILTGTEHDVDVKIGDTAVMEFTQGGPIGGYWKIIETVNNN